MNATNILIRPERVSDYAEIGALHARAFGNRAGEPTIVALQRQRREFDPELSLVAEFDGRVAGHALFSPYRMRLSGQTIPTVNLAPIAVIPELQGQGIGGRLIAEGHTVALSKGYTISILLGHPTYYPRFGYRTHAFGSAQLVLSPGTSPGEQLEMRSPENEDIAALRELWQHEEQGVDMALEPGYDLLDWLSPHPAIQASVYIRSGEVVGYTRIHRDDPTRPRVFLAHDARTAHDMLVTMASKLTIASSEAGFVLPLHPFSASAATLGHAECQPWEAAMACELAPSPLPDYLAALQAKRRPAGRTTWPVAFDLV